MTVYTDQAIEKNTYRPYSMGVTHHVICAKLTLINYISNCTKKESLAS